MDPFVSVITPFYNTASYLAECIESVLAQTHAHFEYVLVDNHSTDGSADIAARYAQKDPRIRVTRTPEFFGQVANYNYAMTRASDRAQYVKIVQADDWIFPRCLTEMVALAEAHPSIGVVSSYDLRESIVTGVGLHASLRVLSGRDAARLYLKDGIFVFGSPTTVLFSADVVRSRRPFYEQGRLHEDTEAVLEILKGRDFGFVHQVLSFMRQQADSITGRVANLLPSELDRVINVRRHGPAFLSAEEYDSTLQRVEREYHQALARRWLRERITGKDASFWAYHRDGLATVGQTLRWEDLAMAAGAGWARRLSMVGEWVKCATGTRLDTGIGAGSCSDKSRAMP